MPPKPPPMAAARIKTMVRIFFISGSSERHYEIKNLLPVAGLLTMRASAILS
jgi:hypothetical protein